MKYQQLLNCFDLTQLSPEDLSPYIGVSNMTIRRWKLKPDQEVDSSYVPAAMQGLFSLVADGKLDIEHPLVMSILNSRADGFNQQYSLAVLRTMGLDPQSQFDGNSEDHWERCLALSGSIAAHQERVAQEASQVDAHSERSVGWREIIQTLRSVLASHQIGNAEKAVAFGALFYLILPFDFIPDHIPLFGFLDDFAVLGIAARYYQRQFSQIF